MFDGDLAAMCIFYSKRITACHCDWRSVRQSAAPRSSFSAAPFLCLTTSPSDVRVKQPQSWCRWSDPPDQTEGQAVLLRGGVSSCLF